MGDSYNSTISTRCRGRDNYSSHCTHNGPSKAVWTEIIVVGLVIFGLFFCYVRWASKQREQLDWIEWNDDDDGDLGPGQQRPYYHMHPDLNTKRKSLRRGANSWVSKMSSRSLKADLRSSLSSFGGSLRSLRKVVNVAPSEPQASDERSNVPAPNHLSERNNETPDESSGNVALVQKSSSNHADTPSDPPVVV